MGERKRGPMDYAFEDGYIPCDEPPGIEEREYRKWRDAGGMSKWERLSEGHKVDSTAHQTGQAALLEEICRLKRENAELRALLLEGADLGCVRDSPSLSAQEWRDKVRKQVGDE